MGGQVAGLLNSSWVGGGLGLVRGYPTLSEIRQKICPSLWREIWGGAAELWVICALLSALRQLKTLKSYCDGLSGERLLPRAGTRHSPLRSPLGLCERATFGGSRAHGSGVTSVPPQPPGRLAPSSPRGTEATGGTFPRAVGRKATLTSERSKRSEGRARTLGHVPLAGAQQLAGLVVAREQLPEHGAVTGAQVGQHGRPRRLQVHQRGQEAVQPAERVRVPPLHAQRLAERPARAGRRRSPLPRAAFTLRGGVASSRITRRSGIFIGGFQNLVSLQGIVGPDRVPLAAVR